MKHTTLAELHAALDLVCAYEHERALAPYQDDIRAPHAVIAYADASRAKGLIYDAFAELMHWRAGITETPKETQQALINHVTLGQPALYPGTQATMQMTEREWNSTFIDLTGRPVPIFARGFSAEGVGNCPMCNAIGLRFRAWHPSFGMCHVCESCGARLWLRAVLPKDEGGEADERQHRNDSMEPGTNLG